MRKVMNDIKYNGKTIDYYVKHDRLLHIEMIIPHPRDMIMYRMRKIVMMKYSNSPFSVFPTAASPLSSTPFSKQTGLSLEAFQALHAIP